MNLEQPYSNQISKVVIGARINRSSEPLKKNIWGTGLCFWRYQAIQRNARVIATEPKQIREQ